MSGAFDDLIAEMRAHPKIIAAVAANTTAEQLIGDDPSVAHLLQATGRDTSIGQLFEFVADMFERLQTTDTDAAVELTDAAAAIARMNLPIRVRFNALYNLLVSQPRAKLDAAGINDPPPADVRPGRLQ
jgi:hypothetical protein